MGIFKRTIKKPLTVPVDDAVDFDNDVDASPDIIEENDIEEEAWPPDVGHSPPRRKILPATTTNTSTDNTTVSHEATSQKTLPLIQVPQTPSKKGTVRVSADIKRELHTRLKIHAIRTGQSLIEIFEDWITTYTTE